MNDRYPDHLSLSPLRPAAPPDGGAEDDAGRSMPPDRGGRRLSDNARTALLMAAVCAGSIAFGAILAFAVGGH